MPLISIVKDRLVGIPALTLILSLAATFAWAESDLPPGKLIDIVLANLEAPLPPDWTGCKSSETSKSCKVRDFLATALTDMAEEGFNQSRPKYLKGKKPANEDTTQDGQPSWSSAKCEVKKATPEFMGSIQDSPIHHKSFSEALKKHRGQNLYVCAVSWGVDFGESKWHKELRFFLDPDKKLIQNSFGAHWTP